MEKRNIKDFVLDFLVWVIQSIWVISWSFSLVFFAVYMPRKVSCPFPIFGSYLVKFWAVCFVLIGAYFIYVSTSFMGVFKSSFRNIGKPSERINQEP